MVVAVARKPETRAVATRFVALKNSTVPVAGSAPRLGDDCRRDDHGIAVGRRRRRDGQRERGRHAREFPRVEEVLDDRLAICPLADDPDPELLARRVGTPIEQARVE